MTGSSSPKGRTCTWINGLKEPAGFRVSRILAVEGSEEFGGSFGGGFGPELGQGCPSSAAPGGPGCRHALIN